MADEPYEELGHVIASKYRLATIESLTVRPQTPAEIGEAAGFHQQHISRAMSELQNHGLVELLSDDDARKGRIYGLTDDGEAVADLAAEDGRIDAAAADGSG